MAGANVEIPLADSKLTMWRSFLLFLLWDTDDRAIGTTKAGYQFPHCHMKIFILTHSQRPSRQGIKEFPYPGVHIAERNMYCVIMP